MEMILKDIGYAFRMLRKSPAFTAVAILTLALGIGANTAMFSVIRAVMLKPLPYQEPEKLFKFTQNSSYPDLLDLKRTSKMISGIAGYREHDFDLTSGPIAERATGALVTGDLFTVLGVRPMIGRVIQMTDDVSGGAKIVMLSHDYWKNFRESDPNIVGKTISIAGSPYTIVGVLPPGFELPFLKADLYSPIRAESPDEAAARGAHSLRGVVRLAANSQISQVQQEFSSIAKQLEKTYPESNTDVNFVLSPWRDFLVRNAKKPLLILMIAVGFVLLIACTNVANLFLARATERQREMAVRAAMGAGRGTLLRQLIIEGIVLAFIGGIAGLIIATWMSDLAIRLGPKNILRLDRTQLDFVVFAVTLGISVLTGLLFSLVPGLHASKINLEESLKESTRTTGSRTRQKMRNTLAALEIGLAIVLLIGAGLLIRSFWQLQNTQPGFRTDHLLTMNFTLPLASHADIAKRNVFFEQVEQGIRSLPGVESVGATSDLPFGDGAIYHNLGFEGRSLAVGKEPEVWNRAVSPSYFKTLGIRVLMGRAFSDQDRSNSLPVAIVNEKFVREFFPDQSPIGKRVNWIRDENPIWMTIVGVVSDVKSYGLDIEEQRAIYTPIAQETRFWKTWMNMVVRTSVEPSGLIPSIQKEVAAIDKSVPVTDLFPMEALISDSVGERRFHLLLMGLFAGLALLLASIGIYGILSYSVRQRTQEMGIRMALGATKEQILQLIVKQGMRLALIGTVAGIAVAFGVTRFLQTLLYAIAPTDLLTFAVVPVVVLAVALLACYAPARRATRVNPIVALRYE
jgi:putative ABC transport system permease protein